MIAHIALWLAPATVLMLWMLALPRCLQTDRRMDVLELTYWIALAIGFVGAVWS